MYYNYHKRRRNGGLSALKIITLIVPTTTKFYEKRILTKLEKDHLKSTFLGLMIEKLVSERQNDFCKLIISIQLLPLVIKNDSI